MSLYALKALENGGLDLSSALSVVREMITHWPQVVAYISSTGQRQDFQPLEGQLCIFNFQLCSFGNSLIRK